MPADTTLAPCGECGMPCTRAEYHPYAACLMFKACQNSDTVRANMQAVRAQAAPQGPALVPLTDAKLVACIERAGFKTWDSRMWVLKRAIEAAHGITGAPNGKPT